MDLESKFRGNSKQADHTNNFFQYQHSWVKLLKCYLIFFLNLVPHRVQRNLIAVLSPMLSRFYKSLKLLTLKTNLNIDYNFNICNLSKYFAQKVINPAEEIKCILQPWHKIFNIRYFLVTKLFTFLKATSFGNFVMFLTDPV